MTVYHPRLRWISRYLRDLAGRTYRLKIYLSYASIRRLEIIRNSTLFDPDWYLRAYPDVARRGLDPARHYLEHGDPEGRSPSGSFDTVWYRTTYPDVALCGENTLVHHVRVGQSLGRPTAPKLENVPWWYALAPEARTGAPSLVEGTVAANVPAIILPVYNAADEMHACLSALRRNTNLPYRLIIIDDASTDPRVAALLDGISDWPGLERHRNPENLGFTLTINRGLALAGRADVVLLNADTEVTPFWLRNLRVAAYSAPTIGTVSPFSNNAGAFSAPNMGRENQLPPWMTLDEHGRAVTQTALRRYPRVPTTSGFCMYVRRDCLDAVGDFDAKGFPRGYGEENDFCMRAGRAGWEHAIDDATLIYHVRSASFGDEKIPLLQQGRAVIDARYPDYGKAVGAFGDPLLDACRQRVAAAVEATSARPCEVLPRGLYVVGPRTGGTPLTNEDLMRSLAGEIETFVLWCNAEQLTLQLYRDGRYLDITTHSLAEQIKAFPHRSVEYDKCVRDWLLMYSIEFVHIRHIAWHSLGLVDVAKEIGVPVIFSFHDFYTICPTVKLLDADNILCGGRCTPSTAECSHELWTDLDFPPLKHRAINDWQKAFAAMLGECDGFVTTTESARDTVLSNFPLLAGRRFEVIPHGRDFHGFEKLAADWSPGEAVRLLVPGTISPAKGGNILRQVAESAHPGTLDIHVLGSISSATRLKPMVEAHGPYVREEFAEKVRAIRPHLGAVLSIWPETYCHTLTEMWACGLPVLGYDLGAVGDRISATGAGWLADTSNGAELGQAILDAVGDQAGYKARREAAISWQRREGVGNSSRLMAARYFALYSTVSRYCAAKTASTNESAQAALSDSGRRRENSTFLGGHEDNPFAAVFRATDRPVGQDEVVAVVGPSETLPGGNASTYVRVWERTINRLGQSGYYMRCTAEELLAMLALGAVTKAVIHRDAVPAELIPQIMDFCAAGRLDLAIDLDDNLFEVSSEEDPNGCDAGYGSALVALLTGARAVTVSTAMLAEVYGKHARQTFILPNRLSRRIWGLPPNRRVPNPGRVTVLYLGAKTHDADLALVLPFFDALSHRNSGLRLRVIGGLARPPMTSQDWLEIVQPDGAAQPYPAFVHWLQSQVTDVDFAIGPLADTVFNRCSSGLRFLDYAALGLSGLYSDLPGYRALVEESGTGWLVPNGAEWTEALEAALADLPTLRAAGARARAWVMKSRFVPAQHFGAMPLLNVRTLEKSAVL